MKLIKQSYKILEQKIPVRKLDDYSGSHFREEYIKELYKHIELCGRTCYRSEDKITEDSASRFVNGLIKSKHCYTGDSEVLTDKGWIKWKDYNGEKVATVNSNLDFIGYEIPERIIKHKYSGNFYEYPELGLKVTDGHTMFGMFRDSKHNFYNEYNYEKFTCNTPYKDNNGRSKTLGERTFKTPVSCNKPLVTDPYYELIGFWLGDGCHMESIPNKLKFHLKKERKIKYLESLCNELGYGFEICKSNQYSVNCSNIGRTFNSLYYENGNKKIEEYNLTTIQIHSIIQGLIKSDGNETTANSKTITFLTTSESIKNWILRFGPLAGYNITYGGIKYPKKETHNIAYKIYFKSTSYVINNDSRKKDKKVIITNESNEVFCVTVSTGLLLVRGTNGQVSICGNCSVLEHGTIYLRLPYNDDCDKYEKILEKYEKNPYSKTILDLNLRGGCYVTTNYRVIIENGWEEDLQYLCEPTKYHEKRYTVLLHSCIHCYKDLTRHRKMSFSIESTRYVNYSKTDKFGEMKFILPTWLEYLNKEGTYYGEMRDASDRYKIGDSLIEYKELLNNSETYLKIRGEIAFLNHLFEIELLYRSLVRKGWQPQQAAEILPQCTAADVVMSGFVSDFEFIFRLRTSYIHETGQPHPLVAEIMDPLYDEFVNRNYINKLV